MPLLLISQDSLFELTADCRISAARLRKIGSAPQAQGGFADVWLGELEAEYVSLILSFCTPSLITYYLSERRFKTSKSIGSIRMVAAYIETLGCHQGAPKWLATTHIRSYGEGKPNTPPAASMYSYPFTLETFSGNLTMDQIQTPKSC